MRRVLKLLAMSFLALVLGASPALAASPHFVGEPTCVPKAITQSGASITCSGKAAGLGTGPASAFLTADQVRVQYICVNRGGNTAPGHPSFFGPVTGATQQINTRQGQITFNVSLNTPANPPASQVCPNANWRVQVVSATFVNVVLHIQQPAGTDILTWFFHDIDPS